MAIEWEQKVREIVEKANLLPRPALACSSILYKEMLKQEFSMTTKRRLLPCHPEPCPDENQDYFGISIVLSVLYSTLGRGERPAISVIRLTICSHSMAMI